MLYRVKKSIIAAICALAVTTLASCGGGDVASSGGGTGFGGTGISLVKGNISSLDGQVVVLMTPALERHEQLFSASQSDFSLSTTTSTGQPAMLSASPGHKLLTILQFFIEASLAQQIQLTDIVVFGGGRSSAVDANGNFELVDVETSDNFVLSFRISGQQIAALSIGTVAASTVVDVVNVDIDSNAGQARAQEVKASPAAPSNNGNNGNNGNGNSGNNGNNGNNGNGNSNNGNGNGNNGNGNNGNGNGSNGNGNNGNNGNGNSGNNGNNGNNGNGNQMEEDS